MKRAAELDLPGLDAQSVARTIARHWRHRAETDPAHVYCTFAGRAWTIDAMDRHSNRIANGLAARLDAGPGTRVALMLPNDPDHVGAIFGLAKAGMVRIPVNVNLRGPALAFLFDRFAPRALIADIAYREALAPVLAEHPEVDIVWRDGTAACPFAALLAAAPDSAPEVEVAPDDIIAITPSSGTTGEPKGVLKTDLSLRAGPLGIFALTDADRGDVLLHWEPLYHGAGVAVLIAAAMRPLTLAMVPQFSASRFWSDVRENGVTLIHYLGGVLPIVLSRPPSPAERDHKVRMAWGGGCSQAVAEEFTARTGVPMREGYGLSEMTTFVTVSDGATPTGSCGRPLPFYETRLRPVSDDAPEPPDLGELLVHPLHPLLAFRGYDGRPNSVEEMVTDGWFSTGDLMRRDAAGNLTYAGRLKDSVRRRGVNISAWEVERVFQQLPEVEECALIGVESAFGDDDLKMFVKPAEGVTIDPAALIERVSADLPYFQVPRYLAVIADFDKTPTQRIIKAGLSRATDDCFDYEREIGRLAKG
ncbi:AMP-binding protein [Acuticoccus kandeliae]|uniref:AMP-binding protein n=1 Tax=Acuticoccus kandeliae TaxID=2073160 RepID=UPI000D3E1F6F|nr:AMP-binding protein [Acuticoccus kandeliae]